METFSLDQFKSLSFLGSFSSNPRKNCFYGSKMKNWTKPISQISCCSTMEQLLRPRPKKKIGFEENEKEFVPDLDETQITKKRSLSPSGLCAQIEKLVLCNRFMEAMKLFEMLELDYAESYVGASTYDALVSACIGLRSIRGVKRVFNFMKNSGFELDLYTTNRVLFMHVKCNLMRDARMLFDGMAERDSNSWMMMIGGLVLSRNYSEAFELFLCMWEEFNNGEPRTFAAMVRASAGLDCIEVGKQIHTCILKRAVNGDPYVDFALIDMYSKCGNIEDARGVFDQMPQKTTVGWNTIIAGYAFRGYSEKALGIYYEMRDSGAKIDLKQFQKVIKRSLSPSVLCAQIEKLVLCNKFMEAMELFEMLELDYAKSYVGASTYDALVSACIGLRSIRGVKRVFNFMKNSGFELDLYTMNRVLFMHVKCNLMRDARMLFDGMAERDSNSWMMMIGGLVVSRNYSEAFELFLCMWEEFNDGKPRTFAAMVRASAGLDCIEVGKQIHTCILKRAMNGDPNVDSALIDMYSKCGNIEDAQCVFDQMPQKTTVGWNTIIAGYAFRGYSEKALGIYYEMRDSGAKIDHFTISILIRICARLASLEHAKQAHAALVRRGFGTDLVANSTLVDFYSKWGRMEDARHVFDKMHRKNVISWNALIGGYGNHGQGEEAIEMYEKMLQENMTPNHVTFLAVLSACRYSGLSERGWEIFQSMSRDHNIKPRAMHYACMIELLGRESLLDEAVALIRNAPFPPTLNMWAALLTACRIHENLEVGKFAAEKIYGLEPKKLCNYVVLLNIYKRSGKLKEAAGVLQTLKRKGFRMLLAHTWIKVNKQLYAFLCADKSHKQTKNIYKKVDNLMVEISKHGYVMETDTLLPDVDEEEQRAIKYHSEKLAIAFGIINTPDWLPLQITQSHRVCDDCHNAIKLITLVTGREIVLRDASRFHHFKNGSCSCGNYW